MLWGESGVSRHCAGITQVLVVILRCGNPI